MRIVPALVASLFAFATTGVLCVVTLVVRDILQVEPESDGPEYDQDE